MINSPTQIAKYRINRLTNSIVQGPSLEAHIGAVGQEIPSLLWNPCSQEAATNPYHILIISWNISKEQVVHSRQQSAYVAGVTSNRPTSGSCVKWKQPRSSKY
jgi:hypothetical protein